MDTIKSNEEFKCKYFRIQEDVIKKVGDNLPSDDELENLVKLFEIFTNKVKIKMIYILFSSEVCLCEIAKLLNMKEDQVINHLKELETLGVVKHKQKEDMTCYNLVEDHVRNILVEGYIHSSRID